MNHRLSSRYCKDSHGNGRGISSFIEMGVVLLGGLVAFGCQSFESLPEIGSTPSAQEVQNGVRMNSLGSNGTGFNGINLNGFVWNAGTLNAGTLNAGTLNGSTLNAGTLNTATINGFMVNAGTLNAGTLNAGTLNAGTLNAADLRDMQFNGQWVDQSNELTAYNMLAYLAECALTSEQTLTITDLDGVESTVTGVQGFDTGWYSDSADLTKSEVMGGCFVERATAAGDSAYHTYVTIPNLKTVLKYLIQCALPEGESVTLYDENDDPWVIGGAFGLAPEWQSGAPSLAGQKRVSACLAARSNALQQPVLISIRGVGLPYTQTEIDMFETHEGGFWGNVFDEDEPQIDSCIVEGGGLSGRLCTQGEWNCGFEPKGDCANVCNTQDSTTKAYSDCNGETEVINTFLNLGNDIEFGLEHNCMVRDDDKTLWCWGKNQFGQLGQGSTSAREDDPVQVPGLTNVAEAVGGKEHVCARTESGVLHCWGHNNKGQIGDGTTSDRSSPVQIAIDTARITAMWANSCRLHTNGSLQCWGSNTAGEVGNGSGVDESSPVTVSGLGGDVVGLSTGSQARFSCAIKSDGALYCWGVNDSGQLGNGTIVNQFTPQQVDDDGDPATVFNDVTDVCTGGSHTCARKSDGTIWCWGDDTKHQIGDGLVPTGVRTRPVQTIFPGKAVPGGLSCGDDHTCAIREDGSLLCWGTNSFGELGNGTTTSTSTPTHVDDLSNKVAQVTASGQYTCATTVNADLYCWGRDPLDLLFVENTSTVPVLVDVDCNDNGVCEPEHAENCNVCASDCGACPAP